MNPFCVFIFILCSFINQIKAQKIHNDFSAILHEETVNKVMAAIGEVSGKNDFEVLLIKGHYDWTIVNPQIHLNPDSSDFTCDAKVKVGPFKYKTEVKGNVKIGYDNKSNLISIKITRAIFELYTMLFNKKIHIKDIHLEDYFKDPFVFDGPRSIATNMTLTLPDSTLKTLYVHPTSCVMKVMKQMIVTSCEVEVTDEEFSKKVKVTPPTQASDKLKNSTSKN